jgi:hypothetical protein
VGSITRIAGASLVNSGETMRDPAGRFSDPLFAREFAIAQQLRRLLAPRRPHAVARTRTACRRPEESRVGCRRAEVAGDYITIAARQPNIDGSTTNAMTNIRT